MNQSTNFAGRISDIIRLQTIIWLIVFGFYLTINNFYLLFFLTGSKWFFALSLFLAGISLGLAAYILVRKSLLPSAIWELYLQIVVFALILGINFGFENIEIHKKASLDDIGPVVYGAPGIFRKDPNEPPNLGALRSYSKIKGGGGLIGAPVDPRYGQYSRAFITTEAAKLSEREIDDNFFGEIRDCLLSSKKQK